MAEGTTFVEFILEEAIQSGAMAAFLLMRAGKKAECRAAILAVRNGPLYFLRRVNEEVGWIAPYSQGCFKQFADMTDMSLRYMDQLTYG